MNKEQLEELREQFPWKQPENIWQLSSAVWLGLTETERAYTDDTIIINMIAAQDPSVSWNTHRKRAISFREQLGLPPRGRGSATGQNFVKPDERPVIRPIPDPPTYRYEPVYKIEVTLSDETMKALEVLFNRLAR